MQTLDAAKDNYYYFFFIFLAACKGGKLNF